jgi:hypothetical protein
MLRTLFLILAGLLVLLCAACGGGNSRGANLGAGNGAGQGNTAQQPASGSQSGLAAPHSQSAGELELNIAAAPDGDDWRVTLSASAAKDLYQLAGSIDFDPAAYEILSPEAGGGLGGPENAIFSAQQRISGRLDFAYSIRRFGPGRDGELSLISLKVRSLSGDKPSASEVARAFKLDNSEGRLLARSSSKQRFDVSVGGEVR